MSLSLKKEQDAVKIAISKHALSDIKMDVEFIIDVSGSMERFFKPNGPMEKVIQKSIAAASVIDPDGELNITAFSNSAIDLGKFNVNDFENCLEKFMSKQTSKFWQGTEYCSAINTLLPKIVTKKPSFIKSLFGAKTEKTVLFDNKKRIIFFYTDGEDYGSREELYEGLTTIVKNTNTFIMFIGIGSTAAATLTQIDEDFDGVGFVSVKNINDLTTDDFFDLLVTRELSEWNASRVGV